MSTYQSQPSVIVSDWLDAPFRVNEETVFAVGDVHGCTNHLSALLERIEAEAEGLHAPRLIFLGDLICRGPSSLGALDRWSASTRPARFCYRHFAFAARTFPSSALRMISARCSQRLRQRLDHEYQAPTRRKGRDTLDCGQDKRGKVGSWRDSGRS